MVHKNSLHISLYYICKFCGMLAFVRDRAHVLGRGIFSHMHQLWTICSLSQFFFLPCRPLLLPNTFWRDAISKSYCLLAPACLFADVGSLRFDCNNMSNSATLSYSADLSTVTRFLFSSSNLLASFNSNHWSYIFLFFNSQITTWRGPESSARYYCLF